MSAQMTRVISSPSSSTIGFLTSILATRGALYPLCGGKGAPRQAERAHGRVGIRREDVIDQATRVELDYRGAQEVDRKPAAASANDLRVEHHDDLGPRLGNPLEAKADVGHLEPEPVELEVALEPVI